MNNIINYGGILSYGIPEFRLNSDIVRKTINKILDLGIEVKCNVTLGEDFTIDSLEKEYEAIFIAIGSNEPVIHNENKIKGVYGGNKLLEYNNHPNYKGKKIAVIGGGNVAMDCARTIKKMGAKEVYIIYRREEEQMPAEKTEIEMAKKEGIIFLLKNNIVKFIPNENGECLEKIECIKTKLVQREGKRPVPIDIQGSNYQIDMDYVVMAIGSTPNKNIVNNLDLELDEKGYIKVDENYMTSKKGIFAGGDIIGNKATVAWAAMAGREAAFTIEKYLI